MNQPNFIIFLTDDQGYGDLSCMGATDFRTPNLDRMATSGVRFTDWYSNSPVCSPSRAALLTGRYPGNACRFLFFASITRHILLACSPVLLCRCRSRRIYRFQI